MLPQSTLDDAARLIDELRARRLKLATAESCTGGLIAGALTAVPGSSDVVDRGFVTYSNEAKTAMLGVPAAMIARHGAVSAEVARAMAAGALAASGVDLAVAVTGIAGPGGGSVEKPVGLVHLAAATRDGRTAEEPARYGDIGREGVRAATVASAFALIRRVLS